MTTPMVWAVIENAGYDGENVRHTDSTWRGALHWSTDHYSTQERIDLHVDIAHWDEAGEFWSYDH